MFRFLAVIVLAASTAVSAQSKPKKAADPLAGFDAYIQDAMVKMKGVGLAIAIVKNDSIVYAKGFGVKKLGDPAPVTPKSIFAVGSTSKAFTAAALATLVDQGRLSWDTKVTDVIKGFALYDPAVTRELTVRDLLTHRSGLSRGDRLWMGANLSRAEVIRRVRFHKPTWSLRTQFGYQNIMYLTAGEIIPALTGQSWDDYLRQRLFEPLGMLNTTTTVRGLDTQPDVATPHTEIDGKLTAIEYRRIDNIGPAGSINSNVLDMAQWIRLHLNGGVVGGRPLLSPTTHAELFTPQMWINSSEVGFLYPNVNFLGYGLGWFLFDLAGRKVVEHSGGIDGMTTELMMVPSEKLGVIVLTNNSSSIVAFPVARAVLHRYLGVATDPVVSMTPVVQMLEQTGKKLEDSVVAARQVGKGPSQAIDRYTGRFDNPMFGPAEVTRESDHLVLSIDGQSDPLDLAHWHYDVFRGASRDKRLGKAWVTFRIGSDGTVDAFTVEGFEQEFTRRPAAVAATACEPGDADYARLSTRASPFDSATVSYGGVNGKICYSRPSMRGRTVFGSELVPYDTLWRTGANAPTVIHLPAAAEVAGIKVPAGSYSLHTVPGRTQWTVVVNRELILGGQYPAEVRAKEVGRGQVQSESMATPVEKFLIYSEVTGPTSANVVLEWEKTRVRIPINKAP